MALRGGVDELHTLARQHVREVVDRLWPKSHTTPPWWGEQLNSG